MSKFRLEFKLKQHTPIIHFQSDQSGATLRATELKPKLDRFLLENVEGIPFKENANGSKSLDYKVKIIAESSSEEDIKNKTYFGNMGKNNSDVEFMKSIFSTNVQIIFHSFNTLILENIKNYFSSFLVINNFGTRQSKGFGGFYLDKSDENYLKPLDALKNIDAKYIYAIYRDDSIKIFEHVEVIYPLMKTGINYPDYKKIDHPKGYTDKHGKIKQIPDPSQGRGERASYYKSYLFQYMLRQSPSIGNEKKFIKENFFRPDIRVSSDNRDKRYVRAMLGISDAVEFKDHERKGKIEFISSINRFKSPLTFKIIDNALYIIAHDIPKELYNLNFEFTHTFKKADGTETVSIEIQTPETFDLVNFLDAFADYFNNELFVNKEINKENIFDKKILKAKNTKFVKVSS